jgi:hypothetical protein
MSDDDSIAVAEFIRTNRSREVTREFQCEHPCPSTELPSGACPGYRKDHVRPLGCGGPEHAMTDDRDAKAKDRWERAACPR